MFFLATLEGPPAARDGFTLLELLVVVAVMAIVAGAVVVAYNDADQTAGRQLAQSEMQELKKAILQFKQDTGWLPKQGPFGLKNEDPLGMIDPANDTHWPTWVPSDDRVAWFHSPGNFWQLYENPLIDNNGALLHPLGQFDPNTGRGWRGPYLSRAGNAFVDVGNGGSGDWDPTTGDVIADLPAVNDPFVLPPVGPYFQSRGTPGEPTTNYRRWGRPYFAFDLHDPSLARLVGMGANGEYDGGGDDDLTLFLLR